jgi:hypothetical protein
MSYVPNKEELSFYSASGEITDINKHDSLLKRIPDDIRAVFQVVQGLIVHDMWLKRYGLEINERQMWSGKFIDMNRLLEKILELNSMPLSIPRGPEQRVIACCREFATLMCAILRHKHIPARSRCGFAAYFDGSGKYDDHWICEYWSDKAKRWVKVDPQLDPFQQWAVSMQGNPLDLTDKEFVSAAKAWTGCRTKRLDPTNFGISVDPKLFGLESLSGSWFIRGNLLRDFASMNKVETSPYLAYVARQGSWKPWRLVGIADEYLSAEEYDLLDTIAEILLREDECFKTATALYNENEALRPPHEVVQCEVIR